MTKEVKQYLSDIDNRQRISWDILSTLINNIDDDKILKNLNMLKQCVQNPLYDCNYFSINILKEMMERIMFSSKQLTDSIKDYQVNKELYPNILLVKSIERYVISIICDSIYAMNNYHKSIYEYFKEVHYSDQNSLLF